MTSYFAGKRLIGFIAAAGLLFVAIGCGSSGQSRLPAEADNPNVVAVYGNDVMTLEEFERRYERSSGSLATAIDDSLAEYQDFLERYTDFRLKVRAAEEAGIPELPSVRDEIRTYRSNLARPYLLEQEVLEPLVRTLYERQQEMVDVSHILLQLGPNSTPADTAAAYEHISAVRDSVLQGGDFGEFAYRHSQDPSARRNPDAPGYRGRLGFFSAGRVVEPFETYAYETPIGGVSPVFRTRFGYHILTVHDRRAAVPDIRLSHIMVRPGSSPEDSAQARELMQDLAQQLAEGADFGELARQHSTDAQSRNRGGDIGTVSYDAPLHDSFKEPAFALEEVGDVSNVLETPYGFHLVKLTGREEVKALDEAYDELKELVTRLPRSDAAEQSFARGVVRDRGGRVDTALVRTAFEGVPVDSVITKLVGKQLAPAVMEDTVLVIGDSTFTMEDMADATSRVSMEDAGTTEARAMRILSDFVTNTVIDYEAARLEDRDDEFRRLMQEFRDGLVLFQFMEDSVWTAAEQDTLELAAYYEAHRDEYWWPDRSRIISLQSRSDSLLEVITERLHAGEAPDDVYASFADDTLVTVRMDTTMIADSTNSVYDRALGLTEGGFVGPLPYRGQHIVLVNQGVEAARPKTFEEARTQVVSDYQKIVEERLIQRLRERYNVHTFPQRLVNAYQRNAGPTELTSGG